MTDGYKDVIIIYAMFRWWLPQKMCPHQMDIRGSTQVRFWCKCWCFTVYLYLYLRRRKKSLFPHRTLQPWRNNVTQREAGLTSATYVPYISSVNILIFCSLFCVNKCLVNSFLHNWTLIVSTLLFIAITHGSRAIFAANGRRINAWITSASRV